MDNSSVKGVTPAFVSPQLRDVKESTPVTNVGPGNAEMGKPANTTACKTSEIKK